MRLGPLADKLVSVFSPHAAAGRAFYRRKYEALSVYDAAKKDRSTYDWRPSSASPDLAIIPDLPIMTARARSVCRDNPDAVSALGAFSRNVVGNGIMPEPAIVDAGGQPMAKLNKTIKDRFWDWAEDAEVCDVERDATFGEQQQIAIEQTVEAGEIFVKKSFVPRSGKDEVGLALQMFESEQMYPLAIWNAVTNNEIRGGVEVDQWGGKIAYWFWSRQPNDLYPMQGIKQIRITADQICHMRRKRRPRQARSPSWMHAVLLRMRNLDEYDRCQLEGARTEASIPLIINRTDAVQNVPTIDPNTGELTTDMSGNRLADMQSNMVFEGGPGETVSSATISRPGNGYVPFTEAQVRSIAAGLGLDFETIRRDYTGGSYSSLRQALLETRREYELLQTLLIRRMLRPVYAEWIKCAIMQGLIPISMTQFLRDPKRFVYAQWRCPRWGWIDPVKEVIASKTEIDYRLRSRRAVTAGMGLDESETFDEIQQGREEAAERGITLPEDGLIADPSGDTGGHSDKVAPEGQEPGQVGTPEDPDSEPKARPRNTPANPDNTQTPPAKNKPQAPSGPIPRNPGKKNRPPGTRNFPQKSAGTSRQDGSMSAAYESVGLTQDLAAQILDLEPVQEMI